MLHCPELPCNGPSEQRSQPLQGVPSALGLAAYLLVLPQLFRSLLLLLPLLLLRTPCSLVHGVEGVAGMAKVRR